LGVTNNQTEYQTMTRKDSNRTLREIKAIVGEDGDKLPADRALQIVTMPARRRAMEPPL
jgi:hypothetical protein